MKGTFLALPAPLGRCADSCSPLPRSLLERKELWRKQMEERLRNLPDPDTPPGHTMMPESQRLETLSNLKQSKSKRNWDSSSEKQAILDRIREKRHRDTDSCHLERCLDDGMCRQGVSCVHGKSNQSMSCRLQDWLSAAVLSSGPDVRVAVAPKMLERFWLEGSFRGL